MWCEKGKWVVLSLKMSSILGEGYNYRVVVSFPSTIKCSHVYIAFVSVTVTVSVSVCVSVSVTVTVSVLLLLQSICWIRNVEENGSLCRWWKCLPIDTTPEVCTLGGKVES